MVNSKLLLWGTAGGVLAIVIAAFVGCPAPTTSWAGASSKGSSDGPAVSSQSFSDSVCALQRTALEILALAMFRDPPCASGTNMGLAVPTAAWEQGGLARMSARLPAVLDELSAWASVRSTWKAFQRWSPEYLERHVKHLNNVYAGHSRVFLYHSETSNLLPGDPRMQHSSVTRGTRSAASRGRPSEQCADSTPSSTHHQRDCHHYDGGASPSPTWPEDATRTSPSFTTVNMTSKEFFAACRFHETLRSQDLSTQADSREEHASGSANEATWNASVSSAVPYVYYSGNMHMWPELMKDIDPSTILPKNHSQVVALSWIGSKGVHAPAHYDVVHNVYVQIYGRKRFKIFPPREIPRMNMYPRHHGSACQSRVSNSSDPKQLLSAGITSPLAFFTVDLDPGDVLYLPPFFIHEVTALSTSMSVSLWIDAEEWNVQQQLDRVPLPFEADWSQERTRCASALFVGLLLHELYDNAIATASVVGQAGDARHQPVWQSRAWSVIESRYGQTPSSRMDHRQLKSCALTGECGGVHGPHGVEGLRPALQQLPEPHRLVQKFQSRAEKLARTLRGYLSFWSAGAFGDDGIAMADGRAVLDVKVADYIEDMLLWAVGGPDHAQHIPAMLSDVMLAAQHVPAALSSDAGKAGQQTAVS